MQSGTGEDRYAGWSLVVVYRDPALPLRNLTVFDGLATIQQGDPPLVDRRQRLQDADQRAGADLGRPRRLRGRSRQRRRPARAQRPRSSIDAANPANNVFNSSVSFEGTNTIAQRIPPYVNGLGFDADRIVADG